MIQNNANKIWKDIDSLAETLQQSYSVTGKKQILIQYLEQVKQYPLYTKWFDKIEAHLDAGKDEVSIIEYGPGPGLLAERLVAHPKVKSYIGIEPDQIFIEMTKERIGKNGSLEKNVCEKHISKIPKDLIVMTATYHHFYDKPKALANCYTSLKKGGELIIAEVFLPDYKFDAQYNPANKKEFIESVLSYASAQIKSMPNPRIEDISDQIKTAFLDIMRIEELKVCPEIVKDHLQKTGFKDIRMELMKPESKDIDANYLGYWYVTAKK